VIKNTLSQNITLLWGLLTVLSLCAALSACQPQPTELAFRNWEPETGYVGSESCRPCHAEQFEAFSHSEMGHSIVAARRENSKAVFDAHALVYDSTGDFFYFPFLRDSQLYIREFRLSEGRRGDTVHLLEVPVAYIVGSGQHTNSHIVSRNGYLFQAPVTFYTQDSLWDLAPGFAHGGNRRFFRSLEMECLSCHSDRPLLSPGSFNRFEGVPQPIGCERCHGPGELHLAEKRAGLMVDTAREADLSIVRPSRLSRERLMDLCQRCHLQGVSVLAEGKSYADFRPGMKLHDYIRLFLPRYDDSERAFIMASQADRLRMSACYQNSEMTCLDCHNPHYSVREQGRAHFVSACLACHGAQQKECLMSEQERAAAGADCITCHMPRSGAIDIPHVRITDHYIRRRPVRGDAPAKGPARFLGLELLTGPSTPLLMAQGYMTFHEQYEQGTAVLDSMRYYLTQTEEPAFREWIYYYFAKAEYDSLLQFARSRLGDELPAVWEPPLDDAYTCYRLGEAFLQTGNALRALDFFSLSTQLKTSLSTQLKTSLSTQLKTSLSTNATRTEEGASVSAEGGGRGSAHPPFYEKLGVALIQLGRLEEARESFLYALALDPMRPVALNNLGYIAALEGRYERAEERYLEALRIEPDYARALLNLAAVYLQTGRKAEARSALLRCLALEPDMAEAQMAWKRFFE